MAKNTPKEQGATAPSVAQEEADMVKAKLDRAKLAADKQWASDNVNALSMPVGPPNTQVSVSQAIENLVSVNLDGLHVIRQGADIPDGQGGTTKAKATVIVSGSDKQFRGLFPTLNQDGRQTKRDAVGSELKKLEASLSGAQAADVSWVTRKLRIQKNESTKGKNQGLMTTTVVRQQIRIKDEAEAMVAAHGKTADFWRKVIAMNVDAKEPVAAT